MGPLPGERLRGGKKEAQEGGDVEQHHPCAVEHLPDVEDRHHGEGPLHGVDPRQGERLRQDVTSVAVMREAVDPGGPALQQPGEAVMTEEAAGALLLDAVLPRGEAPRPAATKDGPMEGSGDVGLRRLLPDVEGLRDGEHPLQGVVVLLRDAVVLLRDAETLLRDDSETILQQDVMTDLTIGAVTDLPLLPLALPLPLPLPEMTNPLRPNPLASLMRVGPRWPSVRRPKLTVWG